MHKILAGAAVLICSAPLYAGLIGSTVNAQYAFTAGALLTDFGTTTVSGAVEYSSMTIPVNHVFSIDITDTSIILTYLLGNNAVGPNGVSFNGFELDFTNLVSQIVGAQVNPSSTMAFRGVSTNNNKVFIDLGGVIISPNTQLTVSTTLQAVPEPATTLPLATGLLGIAFFVARLKAPPSA